MQLICCCRYFHLPPLWLSPSHWSTAFECCNWLPTLWFLAAASICCLQLPALMHTSPMQNVPSQNHTTHCLCTKLFSIDWLVAHEKCDWFATLLCHCFDLLPLNDATAHLNCCHLDLPLLGFATAWIYLWMMPLLWLISSPFWLLLLWFEIWMMPPLWTMWQFASACLWLKPLPLICCLYFDPPPLNNNAIDLLLLWFAVTLICSHFDLVTAIERHDWFAPLRWTTLEQNHCLWTMQLIHPHFDLPLLWFTAFEQCVSLQNCSDPILLCSCRMPFIPPPIFLPLHFLPVIVPPLWMLWLPSPFQMPTLQMLCAVCLHFAKPVFCLNCTQAHHLDYKLNKPTLLFQKPTLKMLLPCAHSYLPLCRLLLCHHRSNPLESV